MDGGLDRIPLEGRAEICRALIKVCDVAEGIGKLNNGRTALYWHLVATLAMHFEKAENDEHQT